MSLFRKYILFFLVIISFGVTLCSADTLKVGTIERPPFAYQEDGEWKGFSVDLWKRIADKNSVNYEFVEHQEFSEMIASTQSGTVDMSVANISITFQREKVLDFSQPIFDSGLNILGLKGIPEQELYLPGIGEKILKGLMWIAVTLVFVTHFFRLFNVVRGNIGVFSYFIEIIPIFFEILRQIREGYGLKIFFVATVVGSVFAVSFYSQKIAYAFSYYDNSLIENNISQYNNIKVTELSDIRVGVTEGSTSESYLQRKNIGTIPYGLFENMLDDMRFGNIDVIVHDDPVIRYFAHNEGKEKFLIVGKRFSPEKFGIAYPEGSQYREAIDRTILEMRESGEYEKIYKKYF